MITILQDKIANYITQYALLSDWKNIREHCARYCYLTFMCLIANKLEPDCKPENISLIFRKYFLEDMQIIQEALATRKAIPFMYEILELINEQKVLDINQIYQGFLARDFILKDNTVFFDDSKNQRDILGAYYTQEDFAYEITQKTIADYNQEKRKSMLKIADYSCGGGAFLVSACKLCKEQELVPAIFGYDVDPIAVLITRFRLFYEAGLQTDSFRVLLGNPLLRNSERKNTLSIFKCALSGRFYHINMGIFPEQNIDIAIGNPPWEKIRFEEKKFLRHFSQGIAIGTRTERDLLLQQTSQLNQNYYKGFIQDYETAKTTIKNDSFFEHSSCGELNTYALFTELCLNSLGKSGAAGIIVKSSLVKMPVYSQFFKKLTENKHLYELYLFTNRRKIFNIDSREEFSVIFFKNKNDRQLGLALNLDDYKGFGCREKIELSHQLLNELNPETGMIPNIRSNEELKFLLSVYDNHKVFGLIYPECQFGRLVHLTNHSKSIIKREEPGYLPVYEGKFIELYTGKFATFQGMPDLEKYKNKAAARPIKDVDGSEYPQSRFFIQSEVWKNLSKSFSGEYVIAWRSLTSATNRRTMLSTILPFMPACQSIQVLQLSEKKMLHLVGVFNSIVFDYIVRLKMAGLDLTQKIIRQIPVPDEQCYNRSVSFQGIHATMETHINSRLKKLYLSDTRMNVLFEKIETYPLSAHKTRKELIAEIDLLAGMLYSIDRNDLRKIALSFSKFYSEQEVERFF